MAFIWIIAIVLLGTGLVFGLQQDIKDGGTK
jgi:hypothetical protein